MQVQASIEVDRRHLYEWMFDPLYQIQKSVRIITGGGVSTLDLGWRRRLPVILQTEVAECGMACLAMILGFHGHRIDLDTLRRRYAVSLKGSTLNDLTGVASSLGLATRALRLELSISLSSAHRAFFIGRSIILLSSRAFMANP